VPTDTKELVTSPIKIYILKTLYIYMYICKAAFIAVAPEMEVSKETLNLFPLKLAIRILGSMIFSSMLSKD